MTKSKVRESTVVLQIKKALDIHYPGFYFKSHGGPFQMAGLPDIIGVHRGRFIGIEVKCPGKEHNLSLIQKKVIGKIKGAGGIAFMATSAEQVLSILKEEFKNEPSKGAQPQTVNSGTKPSVRRKK